MFQTKNLLKLLKLGSSIHALLHKMEIYMDAEKLIHIKFNQ